MVMKLVGLLVKLCQELKLGKLKYQHLDWNTLLGKVLENGLAILWIDNGPESFQESIRDFQDYYDYNHYMGGVDIADQLIYER
ncbi:11812_t:CDS:2, partial [Paraglomus brasilianum]